ncbi:hypothetical protein BP6252_01724 [Coleophoma cylindrospora]|uniref:Uncharacterized protein n=1 Tax=Coleophoma cylindrospora TaxID=1849047 RepID=A0A3D8STQ7_9HELO|nr:hypothetical protein BP6252_01724 [Coleophoma cylindrospora]
MGVHIEPHNPVWFIEVARVKAHLQAILHDAPFISIEHVGSTAIPGLVAKPVLDIGIVSRPEDLPALRQAMVEGGYTDRGDCGIPSRIAFHPPPVPGLTMQRNTYVVADGCLSLRNHLDVRRVLLMDQSLREEYAQVKKALVASGIADVDEYCRGKTEVLLKILQQAGWSQDDLEQVRKANA